MNYVDILHTFLVRRKNLLAFLQAREIVVSHIFAPLSSQILSYISICNIIRKLLAQAFT